MLPLLSHDVHDKLLATSKIHCVGTDQSNQLLHAKSTRGCPLVLQDASLSLQLSAVTKKAPEHGQHVANGDVRIAEEMVNLMHRIKTLLHTLDVIILPFYCRFNGITSCGNNQMVFFWQNLDQMDTKCYMKKCQTAT